MVWPPLTMSETLGWNAEKSATGGVAGLIHGEYRCASWWLMPMNGLFSAKAAACAALNPTSSAMASPGPCVAATASSCAGEMPASRSAALRDGHKIFEMLARGQLRHHAAVFLVEFDLRGDGVGQDFPVAHHGGAGFVAGSFDG